MKKCPYCATISSDYDSVCGVCRGSLAGVSSESLATLEAEAFATPVRSAPRRKLHPKALFAVVIGASLMGLGVYLFIVSGPIGLFLLLGGVAVAASAFGIRGSAPEMGGRGKTGFGATRGKLADQRSEFEEAMIDERREKGEED